MQHIVLDTNCLIQSISFHSKFHPIWQSIMAGENILCVSNEILDECLEILLRFYDEEYSFLVINSIVNNRHTKLITPYFRFNIITDDPDDNKFVDCAITAGAKYIVTNDKHFNILRDIDFPKVDIITLIDFFNQLTNK